MKKTLCITVSLIGCLIGCSGETDTDSTVGDSDETVGNTSEETTTTEEAMVSSQASQKVYGNPYTGGQFHIGPVDYSESRWHNACAPGTKYDPRVQRVEGNLLVGLWSGIPNVASYCDSCIYVTTKKGKSALLRVVTYGNTSTNSLDISPEAYKVLNSGEYPRSMTWQFAKCPNTGPIMYEFQSGAHEWWTSFWVRNARVPLSKVQVKSKNHTNWFTLQRNKGDGTLNDQRGFGKGRFTIRSTAIDGQIWEDSFEWPSSGIGKAFLTGKGNFK